MLIVDYDPFFHSDSIFCDKFYETQDLVRGLFQPPRERHKIMPWKYSVFQFRTNIMLRRY